MKTTSASTEVRSLLDKIEIHSRIFLAIFVILFGYGSTRFILTEFVTGKTERMEIAEAISDLKSSIQDSMDRVTQGDNPEDIRLQDFAEVIERRIELLRIELSPPNPYRLILPLIFICFCVFLFLIYKITQRQTQAVKILVTEMEREALSARKTVKD